MKKTETTKFPQAFLDCLQSWQALRADLLPLEPDAVRYADERLDTAAWAWEPEIQPMNPADLDRTVESLRSPVFSSEKHPWPQADGSPALPVLQVDLARASLKGGVELGNGLLQMFVPLTDSLGRNPLFRVIPLVDVVASELTPVPTFQRIKMPFVAMDWACSEFDEDDEDTHALQIVSYKPAKFMVQSLGSLIDLVDIGNAEHSALRKRIKAFDTLIKKSSAKWSASGVHLFGTFPSIQYKASERPSPLFCLQSEVWGFNFGDGNGQLFFDLSRQGVARFSFDWSCY